MSPDQLCKLLAAPELIVVDLTDDALRALRLAMFAEHPLLDDHDAAHDDPPVRRRARALLRRADHLRRALAAYRRQVNGVLRQTGEDDLPF